MYLNINLDHLNSQRMHRSSMEENCNFLLNGTEIKDGDIIVIRGKEAILSPISLYLLKKYKERKVDFIFESYGGVLYSDYIQDLIRTYRIRELRVHLYSLNFLENDKKLFSGHGMRCLIGIKTLTKNNFRDISLITKASSPDFQRIEGLLRYIEEGQLKNLYIRLEETTPIVNRIEIIKEFVKRFKGNQKVIIENNGFMMKLPGKNDPIEIKSDPATSTVNLVIRNPCTSNCNFCTTRIVAMANNAPLPYDDKREIIKAIKKEARRLKDIKVFEIVAVEPLEHPFIIDILKEASSLGFKEIRLLTHGRLLSDKNLLKNLKQNKVKEITIPITFYSDSSALLNVGDKNHYYDIVKALKNIKGLRGIRFVFNIIISKTNYADIQKIYEFIKRYGFKKINFTLALPSIEDERFYIPYAVRFSEILKTVSKIEDSTLKYRIILSLLYYIPACLIIRFFGDKLKDTIQQKRRIGTPSAIASKRESARYKSTTDCKNIDRCPHKAYCCGINEIYVKVFGDEEFYF